jgi:hypothetical protein
LTPFSREIKTADRSYSTLGYEYQEYEPCDIVEAAKTNYHELGGPK